MTKIFFGVGGGFTGTQLLSKILDQCNNVYCRHEIRMNPSSPYALFDNWEKANENILLQKKLILKERFPFINRINETGECFGEINSILRYFILGIYKIWERDVKFIYLIRNPKTHILSIYNRNIFDKDNFRGRFIPKIKDCKDTLIKSAYLWNDVNQICLNSFKIINNSQVFIYKFEELCKGLKINDLCNFLEIEPPKKEIIDIILSNKYGAGKILTQKPIRNWKRVNEKRKKTIVEIICDISRKLGYGCEF